MMSNYKIIFAAVFLAIVQLTNAASLLGRPSFQRPTTLLSKFYGFSKYFPSDHFAATCDEARQKCANRCSEENMEFQCSQFYGIRSTCTCITKPQVSQNGESARCNLARSNCERNCVGEPNFQCADNGILFSQSCSCVEFSSQDESDAQTYEPSYDEPEIEDVDENQVVESHVFGTVELYSVPEEESVSLGAELDLEELYGDAKNDSDSEVVGYDDVDECELAFSDCQIKCGKAVPEFECLKQELVTSTTCACVSIEFSENQGDETVLSELVPVNEGSVVPEPEKEPLSDEPSTVENTPSEPEQKNKKFYDSRCQQAHSECAQKCGGPEFKFDCINQGNSFAKSCVCTQKVQTNDEQPVVTTPKDDTRKEESQEDVPVSKCEIARKDCKGKCGALEPKFDCKSLGSTFVKSCSCSSGSSFSSAVAQTSGGSFNSQFKTDLLDKFRWSSKP